MGSEQENVVGSWHRCYAAGDRPAVLDHYANDAVVFVEGIDTFTRTGKELTLHWSVVLEINAEGKIAQQRDYWDNQELQAQLT